MIVVAPLISIAVPATAFPSESARVECEQMDAARREAGRVNTGTGLLFVPAVNWCSRFALVPDDSVWHVPGHNYIGGETTPVGEWQGWLTALDARDGSVRWRYRSERPLVAAVTTTGGGLVFTGEMTGDFLALDAATGKERYRFNTGGGINGGVATYAIAGTQYIAVTSGGGTLTFGGGGSPTFFVFALPARK